MKLLLCAMSLLFAGYVFATGSVAETRVSSDEQAQKITLAWTSALDGTVAVTSQPVRGEIRRVVLYNGTPVPTNTTYAVTLKDASGIDVLGGQGAAIASNTAGVATQVIPGALLVTTVGSTNLYEGVVVNEKLSLAITGLGTNATAGKQGTVILYVK